MAADMEASMFSMFSMFNMHVHACVCVHVHGTTPTHLKFDNTSTYQDISIPFENLKSVKNSPPMGGCVVWWVGGWLGGLMGGVRSNH